MSPRAGAAVALSSRVGEAVAPWAVDMVVQWLGQFSVFKHYLENIVTQVPIYCLQGLCKTNVGSF